MQQFVKKYVKELKKMLDQIDYHEFEQVLNAIIDAYHNDKQIFIIGNGGSASMASHMACDLGKNTSIIGRRRARVMSLTDNVAMFTAIANDCGYDEIFTEQLKNLLNPGDLVIGISGSGNSPNVVKAFQWANQAGGITASIVCFSGGKMKEESDICLHLKTNKYGPAEDGHTIINHMIVDFLQKKFGMDHKIDQLDSGAEEIKLERVAVGPKGQ